MIGQNRFTAEALSAIFDTLVNLKYGGIEIIQQQLLAGLPAKYQKQILQYQQEIAHTPFARGLYLKLGELLTSLALYETAAELYKRCLNYFPNFGEAHYQLGVALQLNNDQQGAIVAYNEAQRFQKDIPDIYINLGVIYFEQCQFQLALFYYEKALQIAPDNVEALYNLGEAYAATFEPAKAIAAFQKLLKIQPEDAETIFQLGQILYQSGRTAQAEEQYDKLLDVDAALAEKLGLILNGEEVDHPAEDM